MAGQVVHNRDIAKAFGERLWKCRDSVGMTQVQLSEVTGINQTQISHYELGYSIPGFINLVRLAKGMGMSVSLLIGDIRNMID